MSKGSSMIPKAELVSLVSSIVHTHLASEEPVFQLLRSEALLRLLYDDHDIRLSSNNLAVDLEFGPTSRHVKVQSLCLLFGTYHAARCLADRFAAATPDEQAAEAAVAHWRRSLVNAGLGEPLAAEITGAYRASFVELVGL